MDRAPQDKSVPIATSLDYQSKRSGVNTPRGIGYVCVCTGQQKKVEARVVC